MKIKKRNLMRTFYILVILFIILIFWYMIFIYESPFIDYCYNVTGEEWNGGDVVYPKKNLCYREMLENTTDIRACEPYLDIYYDTFEKSFYKKGIYTKEQAIDYCISFIKNRTIQSP